jgi:hypothetical protein
MQIVVRHAAGKQTMLEIDQTADALARPVTERMRRSGEGKERTVNVVQGTRVPGINFCCSCNVYLFIAAYNAGFALGFLLATPF